MDNAFNVTVVKTSEELEGVVLDEVDREEVVVGVEELLEVSVDELED